MKKLWLCVSLILCLTIVLTAQADEGAPLMWLEQSEGISHVSSAMGQSPLTYQNPMQYQLAEKQLTLPGELEVWFSDKYGAIKVAVTDKHAILKNGDSSFDFFPDFRPETRFVMDMNTVQGSEAIIEQLQSLLIGMGWEAPSAPTFFCTVRQAVEQTDSPIIFGLASAGQTAEEIWDQLFHIHFLQTFGGRPLMEWIDDTTEDEYERRDAYMLVDDNGKIVSAYLFPGYQVAAQSAFSGPLMTAQEAGDVFLRRQHYVYSDPAFDELDFRYEITDFREALVLTHTGVALPAWMIDYTTIITNKGTGQQWKNSDYSFINAVNTSGW